MNIMKTHQLGIDECYHWSAHPHWSILFTTVVNFGVFCRIWDHAGFLSSFTWLNWVMLFHILPLLILSTVREVRDTRALYNSKDNETSLVDGQSLLSIHHCANHAKFPPTSPQKNSMILLLCTGKGIKGKRRSMVPFINILFEFVKNIYNHLTFFQTF